MPYPALTKLRHATCTNYLFKEDPMVPASSSAALASDASAFGSLANMGARKQKKKPVLVLDAEELQKAHALFQQGAAEQLGDYDPSERERSAATLFGLAPMSDATEDDDDAEDLAVENGDDLAAETGLPEPEKVLSLTQPKKPAATTPLEAVASAPEAEADLQDVSPGFSTRKPLKQQALPAARLEQVSDADLEDTDKANPPPAEHSVAPMPAEEAAPPALDAAEADLAAQQEVPAASPDDAETAIEPATNPETASAATLEDHVVSELVLDTNQIYEEEPAQAASPNADREAETAVHNSLRARLVREDVCLARPEPSAWGKFMSAISRLWWRITFR